MTQPPSSWPYTASKYSRHSFDAALATKGSQVYEKETGRDKFESQFDHLFHSLLDSENGQIKQDFLQQRPCPQCGQDNTSILFEKYQIPIRRCDRCAMVYANPCLSPKGEDHLLNNTKVWTREHINFLTSQTYEHYSRLRYGYELSVVERFIQGTKGKHLDVGSGTGLMLEMAHVFGWQSHGIEPNNISNDIARKKGLSVSEGLFPATPDMNDQPFSLITMIDVLEHIADLEGFLSQTAAIMESGNLLFIQVPNVNSLALYLSGADHHSNNGLFHVNYFSPHSLQSIVEKFDFTHLHSESILTEWSIIHQFDAPAINSALKDLNTPLTLETLTPDAVLDHLVGYKLLSIFQKK